ncbi:hypothetical protein [Mesorhizobium japonicum]|uniref:Mlr0480 protein n=1 Tax=Mesorhizobium japonicum (strain LMG 29417 / CECT 9101 / MAFF 303099) TaxID=266835 RepID=Q98MQ4_RHILO|nr:hypothetical protein [Mesorhizobium japonicum]BAB48059.1 mlr0480 [Mesorhizobium japonicum MAFF 303099]
MKPHVRAAVAAIALSHSSGRNVSSVYSYSELKYVNIDASVQGNVVDAYDYNNSCHIDGTLPSLYHYGQNSHIDLQPQSGGQYDGYDYGSNSHFELTVSGNSAELYDYGEGGFFSFST